MGGKKKSGKAEERAVRVGRILQILHQWGIHTLGEFARLDREELAARLGPEAVHLWERARGESRRLLKLVQPPESFRESFEFEHEVETLEPLLFILRRFLEQLSRRLQGVYLVARELTFQVKFSNQQHDERCFEIPHPTNQVDLLFRMLHTHLENFQSEYPIVAVSLEAEPVRAAQQQFGLFAAALRDPNQLGETLARLVGLLGRDRVGTPVLQETHQPDIFRMEPFAWQLDDRSEAEAIDPNRQPDERNVEGRAPASPRPRRRRSSALHQPGSLPQSPKTSLAALRRFRPPPAASILRENERAAYLRSSEFNGAVAEERGPYLASGNWWDGQQWKREEWDLQLGDGAILRCHENGEGWRIDGLYD
jgi:protein ImuB